MEVKLCEGVWSQLRVWGWLPSMPTEGRLEVKLREGVGVWSQLRVLGWLPSCMWSHLHVCG